MTMLWLWGVGGGGMNCSNSRDIYQIIDKTETSVKQPTKKNQTTMATTLQNTLDNN
jgi:hypothetical protein